MRSSAHESRSRGILPQATLRSPCIFPGAPYIDACGSKCALHSVLERVRRELDATCWLPAWGEASGRRVCPYSKVVVVGGSIEISSWDFDGAPRPDKKAPTHQRLGRSWCERVQCDPLQPITWGRFRVRLLTVHFNSATGSVCDVLFKFTGPRSCHGDYQFCWSTAAFPA